jgi:hypothetical protein
MAKEFRAPKKWKEYTGLPGGPKDPMSQDFELAEPGERRFDKPMATVARACFERGLGSRDWRKCQKLVGKGFKPLKMSPPKQVVKGSDMITSSFAELAAAKCEGRAPVEDMVPAASIEGGPCKSTGKNPRCSELTFVNAAMAARTGLPVGPAVRLCQRPKHEGPLVPVRGAQEANDVAGKFCRSRNAPANAPVGYPGDITMEYPDGEPEEIS